MHHLGQTVQVFGLSKIWGCTKDFPKMMVRSQKLFLIQFIARKISTRGASLVLWKIPVVVSIALLSKQAP